MQDAGYELLVTTNQSGIGRGYYSEKEMHAVNSRMAELLAEYGVEFKAVCFLPACPDQDCDCYKPVSMFDQDHCRVRHESGRVLCDRRQAL
ncbi:HAD-IIIA family hydrolase [Maridesulfovibrio sp.]|uniref:HAD-IIIA family hydrolase n=1 Tax=Maridesulfovibrio sp. TaxID=2795000 RepID=UPI003B00697D